MLGPSPCAGLAGNTGTESWCSPCCPSGRSHGGVIVSPPDLPMPQPSERRDPDPSRMQMPQGNPLLLSHTLQELLARDSVQVELIPEKKGLFLKHVEYEVSSQVTVCGAGLQGTQVGGGEPGCPVSRGGSACPRRPSCADAAAWGLLGQVPNGGAHPTHFFYVCNSTFFKKDVFIFRGGEGREEEMERNPGEGEVRRWVSPRAPPTGDPACSPGLRPDWERNRQPLGLQAGAGPLSRSSQGVLDAASSPSSWGSFRAQHS